MKFCSRFLSVNKYGEWLTPKITTYSPPAFPLKTRPDENIQAFRKRLLYNSRKRGILETDLLLSSWADKNLEILDLKSLKEYEILLHENDWNIYYWLTKSMEAPIHISKLGILESLILHSLNLEKKILRMPELDKQEFYILSSESLFYGPNKMSKDIELTPAPTDSVSHLSWSPVADFISVASWDNTTKIYQVLGNGSSQGKAQIQHDQPALCSAWSKDGSKVISVGADKAGRLLDVNTGQVSQVAGHDAPIKCCKWIDDVGGMNNIVVTGSWDKTAKYWDLRSPNPVHTLQLPERCYSLDVKGPLMVIATAERHIQIYNLSNPSTPFKTIQSPLKWQTRVVACFPSFNGFGIGSIEGRVGIQYVEDKDSASNFSFKCHRDDKNVYSVNDISFHPGYGTFSTSGSDGCFNFWDKDSKQRLKVAPSVGVPISATAFNYNGSIFSYAASYDWSKGHEHHQQGAKSAVYLHPTKDEDIKPRASKKR